MHLGTAADMKGMILATVSPSAPSWETKSSPSAALGSCLTLSVPYEQASPLLVSAPWEPPTSCPSSQVHPPQSVHQSRVVSQAQFQIGAAPQKAENRSKIGATVRGGL